MQTFDKMEDIKVGDVVHVVDYYECTHSIRINNIENDKDFITKNNPTGIVCYGTDLELYDFKANEYVDDDYIERVTENIFVGIVPLQDVLNLLEGGARHTATTDYFKYVFTKDANFNYIKDQDYDNIVSIKVFDRQMEKFLGGTGDIHLSDYYFEIGTLDKEFVEGTDAFAHLIDDDYPHKPFDEWLKEQDMALESSEEERDDI